jgi:hypothetical protein
MGKEINFVISLTTLPSRFEKLEFVVNSLCSQNYSNFEVHLNIPTSHPHEGEYKHDLSHFSKYKNLKIFYTVDKGSITKLYPTLLRFKSTPTQKIITVDDDFRYHPNMLEEYNKFFQQTEKRNIAVGFCGIQPVGLSLEESLTMVSTTSRPVRVGILEGYKSVCYESGFFSQEFFTDYYKISYEDDIVISSWLGKNNIEKWCIPNSNDPVQNQGMVGFPLIGSFIYHTGVSFYREKTPTQTIQDFYHSDLGFTIKK